MGLLLVLVLLKPFTHPLSAAQTGAREQDASRLEDLEERYRSLLEPASMRAWMHKMTTRPHHAGSAKARENAAFVEELFRSWGFETRTEVFQILFPTPLKRQLEMLAPVRHVAGLTEDVAEEDSSASTLREEGLPPYNAYSGDGDVTAPLVYVNRGLPRDYEELERHGIDVRGKIVIARYGGSWRGIKPKVATEKGAVGCLIFNDPGDDGYSQGSPYPEGAFKHSTAVQRGSVLDLPRRAGDPLTPGYGATENAHRIRIGKADTIMRIPVLPISAADAQPLLEQLKGPVVPPFWRGALPITYRFGGTGETIVHLAVQSKWDQVPAYNVIAKLPGGEFPDEWIIRGNHHDAWVIGARDPISGLITLLEQARVFGELARTGWRPRRTVVFAVWDAEEPGLIGSTEWVEQHTDELRQKAVAYLNTDGYSRGFLSMGGSHSLQALASGVAASVKDPLVGSTLLERLQSAQAVAAGNQHGGGVSETPFRLEALGSGSDYTPFLQHLGIPSLNVSVCCEGRGGEYHTMFDTYDHYVRFGDPEFQYGIALAEVCGLLTLRLSEPAVLPFDFKMAAQTYQGYVTEVVALADRMREETATFNRLIEEGHFERAADPMENYVIPSPKDPVPYFNLAPLQNAVSDLVTQAQTFSDSVHAYVQSSGKDPVLLRNLNWILFRAEQQLTDEEGLPRRPWFRHLIYAPGFYTGYDAKTLPGVREAIEQRSWDEIEEQVRLAAAAIRRFSGEIKKANALLPGSAATGKP